MRYSRTTSPSSGPRYLVSTAVLVVELIKLAVSLTLATWDIISEHEKTRYFSSSSLGLSEILARLYRSICSHDAWKLVIPAGLYTLQNYLVYIAVGNMEVVSYQITYQLKILTTVLFSMLLLGRTVSPRQWLALVLLTLGVAIVQTADIKSLTALVRSMPALARVLGYPALSVFQQGSIAGGDNDQYEVIVTTTTPPVASVAVNATVNTSKGLLAAVAAACISGLTCVYFEKTVKDSLDSVSLWTRNIQLSFFSLFPAFFLGVLWQDGATIAEHGFFAGYGPSVWITILLQALGGLLVAVCIAYADNVAKNFAASLSIVVSCIVGAAVFWEPMTINVSFFLFLRSFLFSFSLFSPFLSFPLCSLLSLLFLFFLLHPSQDRQSLPDCVVGT
jgi:UDP-sugar transporter A1/2/3